MPSFRAESDGIETRGIMIAEVLADRDSLSMKSRVVPGSGLTARGHAQPSD